MGSVPVMSESYIVSARPNLTKLNRITLSNRGEPYQRHAKLPATHLCPPVGYVRDPASVEECCYWTKVPGTAYWQTH